MSGCTVRRTDVSARAAATCLSPRLATVALAVAAAWLPTATPAPAQDQTAAPVAAAPARALWTNTRLIGSPEPPAPYTAERVLTHIQWKHPLYVAPEPGTNRLWVVLQGGEKDRPSRIVKVENRADAQTVEDVLVLEGRLIYGLTFHPGFSTNGFVYVFSNGPTAAPDRTNQVTRYFVARRPPHELDAGSARQILEWRSAGHDGGDLAFGKDGMLYIASGDGTSDSDTWNSGQDVSNLLAALLRIDVDDAPSGAAYAVPEDNPLRTIPGARPEIWAYGFRNPWRMCVDERTGDIWVGNNGQDLWETAYLVRRGDNFGWSVYEGNHPFYPHRRRGPTPIVPPTIEHHHADFRSLTGGVVYYGTRLRDLEGAYVYGDYSTGKIWGARHRDGRLVWHRELADTSLQIAAFRVDQHGDLLIVDHGGGLYRLIPRLPPERAQPFPTRLSETGLFESTPELQPTPGLIGYQVNASGWADGAEAERFLALPGAARIQRTPSRGWNFTNGTALVQTLWLRTHAGAETSRRRLETRVLLKQDGEWAGYSYWWNDAQTDAVLAPKEGVNREVTLRNAAGQAYTQTWRVPSRAECLACHSRAVNFVLGLCDAQMNLELESDGRRENQLVLLTRLGVLEAASQPSSATAPRLVDPYDERGDLEQRARSYLHANCSVCHVEAGGGNAKMELELQRPREAMNLIGARPQHDSFGIANAMLIAPGEPDRSVLLHRIGRRGPGQMPPLVTGQVDARAVELLRAWIGSLRPARAKVREWTLAELTPELPRVDSERSAAAGKALFSELGCGECHRIAGAGGTVGPDLAGIGGRMDARLLLESILEPSKTIAEEYASHEIETTDGEVVTGRIEREDERALWLRTGSALAELVRVAKPDVRSRRKSALSNMPAGMLDVLEKHQILDLLAYLRAAEQEQGKECERD